MKGAIPITIRGVAYPSKAAAARALSVRRDTLWDAEREGWLSNLGLGKQIGRKGRLGRIAADPIRQAGMPEVMRDRPLAVEARIGE